MYESCVYSCATVCVCVFMRVSVHVCVFLCVCVCVFVGMYVCMCVWGGQMAEWLGSRAINQKVVSSIPGRAK